VKVLDCLKWGVVLGMFSLTAGCGASDSSGSPALTESSTGPTDDHATASTPPSTETLPTETAPTAETSVPPGATILGTLKSLSGDVTVTLDGTSATAPTGPTDLVANSTIETTTGGIAELSLGDAVARLGAETAARVTTVGSTVAIELDRGSVWWTQQVGAATELCVMLRGATASSTGARAFASCDAAGCVVGGVDGAVTLAGAAGANVALEQFQYASVSDEGVTGPLPFPPSALTALEFANFNTTIDRAAGLRPSPADSEPVADPAHAVLDGAYSVAYRTTESDREDLTGETVVRSVTITTDCQQLDCTMLVSVEVKGFDGSIVTIDSPLVFDGEHYSGSLSSSAPCNVDAGLDYTAAVTLVVTTAQYVGGVATVTGFESTTNETNVVTAAGRAADCRINLRNDPFSVHSAVLGVGTRA